MKDNKSCACEIVLEAKQLTKMYGKGRLAVKAVDNVNLEIKKGEIVLIMGPSGSGKTTLLSMLGGLLKPTQGKVTINDIEISNLDEKKLPPIRLKEIGFIFQAFNILSALTALENVQFVAELNHIKSKEAKVKASIILERLGLKDRIKHLPKKLSGGEQQRVSVARALINDPELILADEPTGNLDSKSGHEVMMLLHDIAKEEGKSVVIVSHDQRIEDIVDRILWLEDGKLTDKKKTESQQFDKDPICGMKINTLEAEIKHEHKGKMYYFCSEKCANKFAEEPYKYLDSVHTL